MSWCHVRRYLYDSDEPCLFCDVPIGRCPDCRHRREQMCDLTRWAWPEEGGCCHYDVAPCEPAAPFPLTIEVLSPSLAAIARRRGVWAAVGWWAEPRWVDGVKCLDPADLAGPEVYGVPAAHGWIGDDVALDEGEVWVEGTYAGDFDWPDEWMEDVS